MKNECALYKKILGKPHKTLLSHSLDTAYVSQYMAEQSIFRAQIKKLSADRKVSVKDMTSFLSLACALHDAGKLHPLFQAKLFKDDPSVQQDIESMMGYPIMDSQGYRHEYGSFEIAQKYLRTKIQPTDAKLTSRELWVLPTILRLHHQGTYKGFSYPTPNVQIDTSIRALPDAWKTDVMEPFCDYIANECPLDPHVFKKIVTDIPYWAVQLCLGLVMTCDWIASGDRFMSIDIINYQSHALYKEQVYALMDELMEDVDVRYRLFNEHYTYHELFEDIKQPRSMQETVATAVHDHPNLDCLLVEAPMGEGKSEAALYAAMNLLSKRGLQGVYFALPTGLTSEAMWPRLDKILERIGVDSKTLLTTGTAWLSDINADIHHQDMIFQKFKLLERFCVGTVDQIMTAAMLSYYSEIKMTAMGAKVVVIDEVHSYDAYMMTVIGHMLKYFKSIGTPVILLSATLSDKARDLLFSHYGVHCDHFTESYPKICVMEGSDLYQYDCKPSNRVKDITCSVLSSNTTTEDDELNCFYEQAVDKVADGGCLAFIVNSVDCAIKSYHRIQKFLEDRGQDTKMFILHARFPMSKKEAKVNDLETYFGKNRTQRPKSAIVVATPIIEMSMDLDFDFMYRQIAPVDAIIQSVGRVARHQDGGTIREHGVKPELIVMNTQYGIRIYGDKNYKKGDHIPLLDVTARELLKNSVLHIPHDIPYLINEVYNSKELDQYYDSQSLREQVAQVYISQYTPDQVVTADRIGNDSTLKKAHIPTRESNIEYVKVAVMSEEQLELVKSKKLKDVRQVYRDTVVSVPVWTVAGVSDDLISLTESTWFEDVLVSLGKRFRIDDTYGFISVES